MWVFALNSPTSLLFAGCCSLLYRTRAFFFFCFCFPSFSHWRDQQLRSSWFSRGIWIGGHAARPPEAGKERVRWRDERKSMPQGRERSPVPSFLTDPTSFVENSPSLRQDAASLFPIILHLWVLETFSRSSLIRLQPDSSGFNDSTSIKRSARASEPTRKILRDKLRPISLFLFSSSLTKNPVSIEFSSGLEKTWETRWLCLQWRVRVKRVEEGFEEEIIKLGLLLINRRFINPSGFWLNWFSGSTWKLMTEIRLSNSLLWIVLIFRVIRVMRITICPWRIVRLLVVLEFTQTYGERKILLSAY